jgi:hypothetical protein
MNLPFNGMILVSQLTVVPLDLAAPFPRRSRIHRQGSAWYATKDLRGEGEGFMVHPEIPGDLYNL